MPNSKTQRRGQETGKDQIGRGRLAEKASSFHGRNPMVTGEPKQLRRPKTVPDIRSATIPFQASSVLEERPRLTKLLLNVTIQGSMGPVQVIMTPESKVIDLIAAATRQYVKEGRRPALTVADPSGYDLHYSQFSLQSLGREEELISLGSRNFFLCLRKPPVAETDGGVTMSGSSCSKEAVKATKTGFS
ncbi:hypothetical protein SAY86_032118 [Trapa natans]|uniref:DUF7054 domain-containing protein n=1 Tax=Trapa natans TaxID=22666 RepID=A0AAN7R852_TRANT|nr:hypothetical protein SAY86_032118 [Trapa natans]